MTLWVALCIVAGIALSRLTAAQVNLPVAVLIWLMIIPMLLKVDFGALHRVAERWRGTAVTVGIDWLVKPFSMALLGWLFTGWIFRPWLTSGQIGSYIAGLIILAAAPCTAMVFVWSKPDRRRAELHPDPGGAQRHDHSLRVCADRGAIARSVLDHGAVDDAAPVRRPLHCRGGDRGAALAALVAGARRRSGTRRDAPETPADLPRLARGLEPPPCGRADGDGPGPG